MKTNLKTFSSFSVLFALLIVCIYFVPAWSCSPPPPPVPYAVLNISPDPADIGQTVLLDGSGSFTSRGVINRYNWDFTNNGSYDYYETPTYYPDGAFDGKTTYVYTEANTYTAKLRVKNSYNYYGYDTDTVVIENNAQIVYTYDEVGNRISMTDSFGTTSYEYDYLNRLITVTNPDSKVIRYEYDAGGNRTKLTDPDNNITNYTYNDSSQLTGVSAPAGVTTYQHDSSGKLARADYPNGTYTLYSYDPQRDWLLTLSNKNSSDTVLSSFSYTYDNVGNRLSVTENGGSVVNYVYDDIYQLTSETRTGTNAYAITYQYDGVGNRTQMVKGGVTTSYACNNNNQMLTETTSGTTVTYAYDLNGNLTSKTGGGNTTSYTWDWNNHLLTVTEPSGTTSYEYDGDGTRISKAQGGVETKYINDVGRSLVQVLTETDNTGTTQATYNYGNDLISMNRASADSFYLYDGLGTTRQLTDSVESVTVSYVYDSFGNLIASSGTSENTYGFTGEQQFKEADDLVFLRARYYDPGIGRFVSKDPIGYYDSSMNLYTYVTNNPVILIDPFGLLGYSPWPGHPPITFPRPDPRPRDPILSDDYTECFMDCLNTMTGGLLPRICGAGLGFCARMAAAAEATTVSQVLAIVPTWMGSAAAGCAIGCGIAGCIPDEPGEPWSPPPGTDPYWPRPGSPGRMY
jgi:RHS repeat-associated protein